VIINRLRLLNFRQHESTELIFGHGLTGIVGPNGAGKTTLLEAIAWAMYGTPAARGNRETIRRRGAPPRARVEVELEFSLGAHNYRIVRTMGGAELYQDSETAPIANSLGAVTERVTRLMGMSRDEFFRTYFTGQKELALMAAMKPGERAQFLSRVLGYERLRLAQDRLRLERTGLRAQLDTLRSGLPDPEVLSAAAKSAADRLDAADGRVKLAKKQVKDTGAKAAELGPRWDMAQQQKVAAAALESDLRLAQQVVETARQNAARLAADLTLAQSAASRVTELVVALAPRLSLREEAGALTRDGEGNARRAGLGAQRKELTTRRTELTKLLKKAPEAAALERAHATMSTVRQALDFSLEALEARRTLWVQDAQAATTKREGLADQYRELVEQRERIVEAGQEGICPTCARPLGREFESVLGVLDRQIEEVTFNGSFYKQRIDQLKDVPPEVTQLEEQMQALKRQLEEATATQARLAGSLAEAQRWREEVQQLEARVAGIEVDLAALPGAVYDQARHEVVQAELKRLDPLALELERQRVGADRVPLLLEQKTVAEAKQQEAEARDQGMRTALVALGFSEDAFRAVEREWRELETLRQAAALTLVRDEHEASTARAAVAEAARRIEDRARRASEADAVALALKTNQELDHALGDLRDELNAALRPDLSELASVFLRDLTNGRYTELELDEDYVTTLLDEGEPKAVISGGEEDVANLALRLAISQMIAERAGQPLSLLILDEIFGSLDDDHRAAVVELLRSLADRFPQVILITHIDSVRDGFDRIVRVSYDPRRGAAVVADELLGGHDVAA
jgi:exonuclease SbcC